MKANQASRTAEYMALFRALESVRPQQVSLFDDPLAVAFLRPRLQRAVAAARLPVVGRLIPYIIDARWPGARTSGVARTRHIDDELRKATAGGARQAVILGAGYDCRAYRLPEMTRLGVYEVDHPDTQRAKRDNLAELLGAIPAHVRMVPVDFNRERLDEPLIAAGFDRSAPTFWIWEGVTNYLTAAAVDETFRAIRRMSAHSRLIFTYVHRAMLDDEVAFPGSAALKRALAAAGEKWTFGFDPAELPGYLAERGYRLVEDVGSVEYRATFFPKRRRFLRGYEFYRLAVADGVPVA